jgi:hypothetical protein
MEEHSGTVLATRSALNGSDRPSFCATRSKSCFRCGFTHALIFPFLSFFGRSRISFSPSSAASSHCCAHNTRALGPFAPHQRIIAERLNAADAVEFSFGPLLKRARSRSPPTPHVTQRSGPPFIHPNQVEPAKGPLVRFSSAHGIEDGAEGRTRHRVLSVLAQALLIFDLRLARGKFRV